MSVRITINGRLIEAEEGSTVLEAAQKAGIEIPTLCHHPALRDFGACRLCIVEVEGMENLPAACVTYIRDGMVIETESEAVVESRKTILELLLANHPQDCLTCEKNGDCRLQDHAYRYGVRASGFKGEVAEHPVDDSNPFFQRDYNKCILCGSCVRMCGEVQVVSAVDYAYRGFETKIAAAFDAGLEDSPCVFCGNCISVCPVGALTPKQSKGTGRNWEKEKVLTICPYCGVGCQLYLEVKDGRVVGVSSADGPANRGLLCVKGHFGMDFIHHPDRLTTPLIKRNGRFEAASWDEALDEVAKRLGEIKAKWGPDAIAGLSSAKCTNEENYLMQKFMRAVVGTNNVDHCARLCHASTVAGLAQAFGSGAMTNSISEIEEADVIFVTGSNTTEAHPVLGTAVKRAKKRGAKLLVADPREIELAEMAEVVMQQLPGTDVALLNGMMHVIIKEGLYDQAFVEERTEGFEEVRRTVEKYPPDYVEKITGVKAEDIVKAARIYAGARNASILYAMGVTQQTTGTDNVLCIANLAMLTGNVGRPNTGVNPLRGQNNVQGACDMGALPNVYPGYQKVEDSGVRDKFEKAWDVALPDKPGLTIVEMMQAALEGRVRGMYIMGENPMVSDPDINHVRESLENLEFLVVQDIFLTETAQLADVVLPAASFAEKAGTFTNTERRIQRIHPAVLAPGEARKDWEIITDVACRMGYQMTYRSPAEIMEEIARLTPIYGGVSYDRLETEGLQWPCPEPDHPGTPYLHKGKFTRGRGLFHAVEYRDPDETPDEEYPYILTTGRLLYHFHTGSMTRRSVGLNEILPEGYIEINPRMARELGISDGDWVMVASRRGRVVVKALVTGRPKDGVVFMPFHFAEAAANVLTNAALDPTAKIPELKVCAVQVEKHHEGPGVKTGGGA